MQQKIDLTVVIPNYNSPFTNKTMQGVLDNAGCEVEVVVNVEEKWPEPLIEDGRVHYIHHSAPIGMRAGINACVALAKGKYIMKLDDHCLVSKDFGKILIDSHTADNVVQVPRRYALDAENWKIEERTDRKYPVDYMSLCYPQLGKQHDDGFHGIEWRQRREDRKDPQYDIDDLPTFQGSCYFMTRSHFVDFLGGLHEEGYGQFSQEAQEISLKTWLGGGAVKVNKKTNYSHLHKGNRYGRFYKMPGGTVEGSNWSSIHWINDEEPNMKYPFRWFINEKFPGMPEWTPDWEQKLRDSGQIKL